MTTVQRLLDMPLSDLATVAMDAAANPTARLANWEALHARVGETAGATWGRMAESDRRVVREAMSTNLSGLTFAAPSADRAAHVERGYLARLAAEARDADRPVY